MATTQPEVAQETASQPDAAPPARDRRRRRLLLGAVGVALAAGVAAVLLVTLGGKPGRGPLYVGESNQLSNPVPVGQPYTYGIPVVFNHSHLPVELRRVSLVQSSPGLELLRVYASGPRRRRAFADRDAKPGYPGGPGSNFTDLHPVPGYRVPPDRTADGKVGVNLVFVLRAPRRGRFGFRGVQVDSRQDGTDYRDVFPNAYVACTGPYSIDKELPPCPIGPHGVGDEE